VHGRRAEAYAPFLEEILRMAHALHVKVLAMGDEFLYYPGAPEEAGATLSVEDPAFWRMLKNKYRRLLKRFPDLDGVAMRIGEMLPLGPFLSFDVIHGAPQVSVAEKYRRFVTALHDVVVGEFGKFYLHRTWAVSEHEVHSQPKEFLAAFREVPRENLLLSIKLTQTDQWQFQAYNPTFGLTDHQTAVEIEIGRGYHHRQEIPDYIVPWVEPGLRYVRSRGATGIAIGAVVKGAQTWADASAYAVSRLAWGLPAGGVAGDGDVRQLARDWSAGRFGQAASKPMGDALMLSDLAMRKSLYLLPYAATHAWDPQAYFMSYRWAVGGNPTLDGGLGHMAFLREFYWYCQPYLSDTERELDEGMGLWDEMMALLAKAEPKIEDEAAREWARRSFDLGEGFLALNAAYLKAMLRYFRYEETLSARDRERARAALRAIKPAMKQYAQAGGYYGTAAITLFMACAARGLRSARAAQAMLKAPSKDDLETWIKQTMAEEARLLRRAKRRVKVLEYRGEVDGREVIRLRGERLKSATDKGEPARAVRCRVLDEAPKGWRVVMKPIRCRDYTYVVEQPSRANKGTVLFCIDDAHDGSDIYEVEMYAIPKK
jgi:hypothetical protein